MKHSYLLAQMVPQDKKVTHNVKLYATRESRDSTRDDCPLLEQSARGDSLQEEGRVAGSSEAGRDAVEAGEAFWTRVCTDKVINPNFFQIH